MASFTRQTLPGASECQAQRGVLVLQEGTARETMAASEDRTARESSPRGREEGWGEGMRMRQGRKRLVTQKVLQVKRVLNWSADSI